MSESDADAWDARLAAALRDEIDARAALTATLRLVGILLLGLAVGAALVGQAIGRDPAVCGAIVAADCLAAIGGHAQTHAYVAGGAGAVSLLVGVLGDPSFGAGDPDE